MAESIFTEKEKMPTGDDVRAALKQAAPAWEALTQKISDAGISLGPEWKYYSKKSGWSLAFKQKKRNLLYLVPRDGYFTVTFVFGEKAVADARKSGLPDDVMASIEQATVYMEGRSFSVEAHKEADIGTIWQLVEIKERNQALV